MSVKLKKNLLSGSGGTTVGHTAAGNPGSVHAKHGSGFLKRGTSKHAKKNRKRG